jgi:hypothetical protein
MMGEKPAVKEILNGTFEYPPGCDRWTVSIMQEARKMFQHVSPKDIVEMVTAEDFQK